MAQSWYKKASVQTALVSGVFLIGATLVVQFSPKARLEKEVSNLKDEVRRLETQLAPFRALAVQQYGGSEEENMAKLAAQVQDLQTQLERTAGTIRRFDVTAVATLAGDWETTTPPNLSNLLRTASPGSDIRVELETAGTGMRWVEFTDSSAPVMAPGESANWKLDYTAQAPVGSWILGVNREDLQSWGNLEMTLYGIDSRVTRDGIITVKSVVLNFFVNGIQTCRCEYKSNFRAEMTEQHGVPIKIHLNGPVSIQKIP